MSIPNNFGEYYKTISNTELLNILDNPENFQLIAFEAAETEFQSRNLSEAEIAEARQTLVARDEQKQKEKERIRTVENKIRHASHSFIDTINPVQSGIASTEKIIRFIVIIFSAIFLYQFFSGFQTHIFFIKDFSRNPPGSLLYLFPKALLPVAILTFWKRKHIGWILLTAFVILYQVSAAWMLYKAITWESSRFAILNNIFPRPSILGCFIQLAFLSGVLFVLCKEDLREVYRVTKQIMVATIIITLILSLLFIVRISVP